MSQSRNLDWKLKLYPGEKDSTFRDACGEMMAAWWLRQANNELLKTPASCWSLWQVDDFPAWPSRCGSLWPGLCWWSFFKLVLALFIKEVILISSPRVLQHNHNVTHTEQELELQEYQNEHEFLSAGGHEIKQQQNTKYSVLFFFPTVHRRA